MKKTTTFDLPAFFAYVEDSQNSRGMNDEYKLICNQLDHELGCNNWSLTHYDYNEVSAGMPELGTQIIQPCIECTFEYSVPDYSLFVNGKLVSKGDTPALLFAVISQPVTSFMLCRNQ